MTPAETRYTMRATRIGFCNKDFIYFYSLSVINLYNDVQDHDCSGDWRLMPRANCYFPEEDFRAMSRACFSSSKNECLLEPA